MPISRDRAGVIREHALGLLLLLLLIAAPMIWVAGYSLAYSFGGIGHFSTGWSGRHWQAAWSVGGLRDSLYYSPLIALVVTLLALLISLGLTLSFPGLRHNRLGFALLCLPLATPGAVLAVMTYQILNPGGFIARLCYHAGWIESPTQFPALVNDPWSIGILITQVSGAVPLLTLFFLKTWTTARIDRYCLLAQTLGTSLWRARWTIALPMLLSRGRPLILLMFLLNLGSYEVPLLLGRQSPQMFSVLTQRRFGQFDLLQRPEAFALATSYLLLVSAGVLILLRGKARQHA